MDNNYIEIDGHYYAIDLKKLFSIIASPADNGVKDKTKTETWGYVPNDTAKEGDFRMVQKEFTETVSDGSETYGALQYDLIKNLLTLVINPIADENGNLLQITDFENMLVGQALAFNTLLREGIIIEITEE